MKTKTSMSEQLSIRLSAEIMREFDSMHSRKKLISFIRTAMAEKLLREGVEIDMKRADLRRGERVDLLENPNKRKMLAKRAKEFMQPRSVAASRARHADDKSALA